MGSIGITGGPVISYKHGEAVIKDCTEQCLDKVIISASASGGWTRMDYTLSVVPVEEARRMTETLTLTTDIGDITASRKTLMALAVCINRACTWASRHGSKSQYDSMLSIHKQFAERLMEQGDVI